MFLRGLRPCRQAADSNERQLRTTSERRLARAEREPSNGSPEEAALLMRALSEQTPGLHKEAPSAEEATPSRTGQQSVAEHASPTQAELAPLSSEQDGGWPEVLVPGEASSAERVTALKHILQLRFCRVAGVALDRLPSVLHSKVNVSVKAHLLSCL